MKKLLVSLLLAVGFISLSSFTAEKPKGDPFYYEIISTPDKSIDLVYGFYHTQISFVDKPNGQGYTTVRSAIINNSKSPFAWEDYKVYILLKDGDLFRNYTTTASSGEYDCTYDVKTDETHIQYLCFQKKFSASDIQSVYVSFLDNKFFKLAYQAE